MRGKWKDFIFSSIGLHLKSGGCDRKKQITDCLSREKDTGFNIRKREWRKLYQKIIRQYTQIRVHRLWSTRIGEYLVRYLRAVEDSEKKEKNGILDVFVLSDCVNHNARLSEILGRNICIVNEKNVDIWMKILYHFPEVEFVKYWDAYSIKKKDRVYNSKDTVRYFKLTEREAAEGRRKKNDMGLKGAFVCVSSRDATYLDTILPNKDYHYHDFRDADINNFSLSAKYLSELGITTVRMGRYVRDKINFDSCIDYANEYYDELLDVILAKDCKFYVGDSSGIVWLPMVLDRPIALKNWVPVFLDSETLPYNPSNLFIFKKYYKKSEDRFLSVREMMQIEKKVRYNGNLYAQHGVEVVENSAEEILDLVVEMNTRIDGKWIESPEDNMLQEKYQAIYREWCAKEHYRESATLRIRVGAMFLRKNRFLLD